MATLALTAAATIATAEAGAAVAFAATAAAGIAGSYIDSMLFAPDAQDQVITREGSRIEDLRIQTSAYGRTIADVRGNMRLAGNVIWAQDIREQRIVKKETHSSGGKGGGGGSTTTKTVTYKYFGTLAVGLCAGPISDIVKIWADSKLIYRADTADSGTIQAAKKLNMTVHHGTETQQPDPLIESYEGSGNVPAHRGLAYVVFDDLPLADFGNRIPSFSFEVQA